MKGLIQPEAAILPIHKESSPAWGMQHQITPTYKASQPQKHTFSQKNTLSPQLLPPKHPLRAEATPHRPPRQARNKKYPPECGGPTISDPRARHLQSSGKTPSLRLTSTCLLHDRTLILTHRPHCVKQKKFQIFPNNTFFTEFHRKILVIRGRIWAQKYPGQEPGSTDG